MAEDTQTLDRLGPYRLLRELGSGGMGTVYLAEDEDEERQVALKVLHPHLVEREGFFKRFQREAQAGECVHHPNVVRTLDSGFHLYEGQPYCVLAMEYVEGQTLRDLLNEYGTVPEALVREIAAQVADGLAAIHEAGIVHRDLKPENVLVTKEHEVRIMDLGVARWTQASTALTREGQFAGSLPYAAPEQFGQAPVGPGADLYALGVVLYELLSGENPFRHDEPYAVMRAHIDEVPESLDRRMDDVSCYLAGVVDTLLQKKPPARFDGARALSDVLGDGEASPWWAERERALLALRKRMPRVPVRRETKVYGRDVDLEMLRGAWTEAREGRGNTVLIMGEAGIGKSRLVDGLLEDVVAEDVCVLYGSSPPAGGRGGIQDAVLHHFGEDGLEDSLAARLTATPTLAPALAAWLRAEAPPEDAVTLQGDALDAALVHLTRGLAKEKPLLLVVEDLHFASTGERKLLLSVARAVASHRILLLLTTRPGIDETELAPFGQLDNHQRVELARLGARDIVLLLRDAFRNERLVEKLGPQIAEKSDGVPFFVFEMIEGLREGQFISRLPDGSWIDTKAIDGIEVPANVRELISVRIGDLSDEERAILDVGAVLGFEFDPGLVAGVLEMKRVSALQHLVSVERRLGVVRSAGHAYRFDHHQIQEVMYAGLPDSLREEYHTLLAEVYAVREDTDAKKPKDLSGSAACFLAEHHLKGRNPVAALPVLGRALDFLMSVYHNEAALKLCDGALAVPELIEGPDRVQVLHRMCALLELIGPLDRLREAAEQCSALTRRIADRKGEAIAEVKRAHVLRTEGRPSEAQDCLQKALRLSREASSRSAEARVLGQMGNALLRLGRMPEARDRYEQALGLRRELGDPGGVAATTINLGNVFYSLGQLDEAVALYEEGRQIAVGSGSRDWESRAVGNLGLIHAMQGDLQEARSLTERSLALVVAIGDRSAEAEGLGHLGGILDALGQEQDALELARRQLALSKELGDVGGQATAHGGIAASLGGLGRAEEAKRHFEKCLDLARVSGERYLEGFALHGLGRVAAEDGGICKAEQCLADAIEAFRSMDLQRDLAEALATRGNLFAESGRLDAARSDLVESVYMARELSLPVVELQALASLAQLESGGATAVLVALAEHRDGIPRATAMHAHHAIWQATGDWEHLAEAKRLLDFLVDHAPAECRESMVHRNRLHREIMEAWAEHGGGG